MIETRELVSFTDLYEAQIERARAIYELAFEKDERVPFEELARRLGNEHERFWPRFDVLLIGGEVVGLSGYGYMPTYDFGYLDYVAVDEALRGQGHGAWICERAFERLAGLGRAVSGHDPRLTFWEVRRPDEPVEAAERAHRERRIRFYQKLGAVILPIDYLCPPIDAAQPPVAFHLMARTYPPGRPLGKADLTDAALAGLVEINGAAPDSEYVRNALHSIG